MDGKPPLRTKIMTKRYPHGFATLGKVGGPRGIEVSKLALTRGIEVSKLALTRELQDRS
jgi:hypothetical protein